MGSKGLNKQFVYSAANYYGRYQLGMVSLKTRRSRKLLTESNIRLAINNDTILRTETESHSRKMGSVIQITK